MLKDIEGEVMIVGHDEAIGQLILFLKEFHPGVGTFNSITVLFVEIKLIVVAVIDQFPQIPAVSIQVIRHLDLIPFVLRKRSVVQFMVLCVDGHSNDYYD